MIRWILGFWLMAAPALAHGLPGSTLTFQPGPGGLALQITLPVEELALALPLEATPGRLAPETQDQVATYLADHMELTDAEGAVVALRLASARIETAQDPHVGAYGLMILDLTAPAPRFPLRLTHDAILHEVRSHRATVYLRAPGSDPVRIAVIRPDPAKPPVEIPPLP